VGSNPTLSASIKNKAVAVISPTEKKNRSVVGSGPKILRITSQPPLDIPYDARIVRFVQ